MNSQIGSHDDASLLIVFGRQGDSSSGTQGAGDNIRLDVKPERPCLLWIDDEISPDDGGVLYLQFGGFQVHCAVTAAAGIAMARARRYDGIVLDLFLPDTSGLAVLASLRAEGITTPVMILTGFGDFESARVAGRLGADGFHAKLLIGDDLLAAVQQILKPQPAEDGGSGDSRPLSAGSRANLASLATLLEVFHRLAQGTERGLSRKHVSETLAGTLVHVLGNPDLQMSVFIACARALKGMKASEQTVSAAEQVTAAEELVRGALARPEPSDPRVVDALRMIRSAAQAHDRIKLDVIAKALHIDATYLGRRIVSETGFDFTDWRTASILRPGVCRLLETNEGIKEIARGLLDFKHLSQFDVEFQRFFGLTPTEFRDTGKNRLP